MAIQTINIGTTANDGTGDDPRTAGSKINDNFTNSNHAASRDVGTASGDLMEVGAFGIAEVNNVAITRQGFDDLNYRGLVGVNVSSGAQTVFPTTCSGVMFGVTSTLSSAIMVSLTNKRIYFYHRYTNSISDLYHEGNTTVDGSGFIKEASPIVKLYSDKIEANDYKEIEDCTFERVDTGHYIIKGAPLLSRNGWYIETLKDRNNNIYFTLDYEELEDGLHVKTYEPDYSTGRATNGAPVDINDGRFVTLRFEEDKTEE